MTGFDVWEVVIAPFPFVDSPLAKPRPCLILSSKAWNQSHAHSLCAMITRPLITAWPSDLPIKELPPSGLPAPSVIRWKLFTLPNAILKRGIGKLAAADQARAAQALTKLLPTRP